MSTKHLIEAIAEEGPVCPQCGSDDLRLVYRCDVIQPVLKWSPTDEPGVWNVDEYDASSADVESELTDSHIECGACAATAMWPVPREDDQFTLTEPTVRDATHTQPGAAS